MNLDEYLAQTDPQRMPNVKLNSGEWKRGATIKTAGGQKLTQIFITHPIFIGRYGRVEYVTINNYGTLYTTDDDGNPRKPSCFSIIDVEGMFSEACEKFGTTMEKLSD